MAALITFTAADIHLEGIEMDAALPAPWLVGALSNTEVGPRRGQNPAGRVTGRLSRSGNDIVVRAHVHAAVEVPCARCLEPADIDVDADMSLLLQPARSETNKSRSRRDEPEYEFGPAEADIDVYDGETVILDAFIREAILLEVPNFPLCRESCPGMPARAPEAAVDERGPDPRLAPLGAFRKDEGPATVADLVQAARQRAHAFGRKPVLQSNRGGLTRKKKGKR